MKRQNGRKKIGKKLRIRDLTISRIARTHKKRSSSWGGARWVVGWVRTPCLGLQDVHQFLSANPLRGERQSTSKDHQHSHSKMLWSGLAHQKPDKDGLNATMGVRSRDVTKQEEATSGMMGARICVLVFQSGLSP